MSTTRQAAKGAASHLLWPELDCKLLAKLQAALSMALRQGQENPVDRAIPILEIALNVVLMTLDRMADEEEEAGED